MSTFRTSRGDVINIAEITQKNELTPAVGNAHVNARGDILGEGGKIVKNKEEVVKEYYDAITKVGDENV
jgi:hypothetical protein